MLDRTNDTPEPAAGSQDSGSAATSPKYSSLIMRFRSAAAANCAVAGESLRHGVEVVTGGVQAAWTTLRRDGLASALVQAWQAIVTHAYTFRGFSSLTRRIVVINVAGLVAFVIGILYLSQFRAGLIDARVQSLVVQGEIIAGAIAASASVEPDAITIDPQRLLELQAGESYGPSDDAIFGLEFPINPERVAPILRRLISPTNTRARIYDRDGTLILDSRNLYGRGDVLRFDLPSPAAEKPGWMERAYIGLRRWLERGDLPRYRELGLENGKGYPEVASALNGNKASLVSINDRAEVIVSVAVPVQRFRTVRGALLLSTQGGDINQAVAAERWAIIKVALIATGIMTLLSLALAATIAGPVRRLADAAERVRRRIKSRVEIPDFTRRRDEIGELSGTLRAMTDALYSRIEGIESFAADVAHELKNPLTSLRSAVETLPLAKSEDSRKRLLGRHRTRRAPARPPDLGYFRRQPPRCRIAAPGRRTCRSAKAAHDCRQRRQRSAARRWRYDQACLRWHQVYRAGPRLAARSSDQQPDRQRALVLAARRHCARDLPAVEERRRDHRR